MAKNDFFDAFGDDDLEIDWSKISMERIEKIFSKLSQQEADKLFAQLQDSIDKNNRTKSIIAVAFSVLQVAAKLGLKVL
jgi:preprotein translocase subunit SecA